VLATSGTVGLQVVLVLSIVVPLVLVGVIGWIFLKAARRDRGAD
jgi:hypothetical protein